LCKRDRRSIVNKLKFDPRRSVVEKIGFATYAPIGATVANLILTTARARGHYNGIQIMSSQPILDLHCLICTGITDIITVDHAFDVAALIDHLLDIDDVANATTTATDKHPNFRFLFILR
jgi:hypothetical protein